MMHPYPRPHLTTAVVPTEGHAWVLNRVQRWAAATDARVVRRLWPAQPDGAQHALCPSCGGTMPEGMLITLNRLAGCFRAGPAQRALAGGDLAALTPGMPIEPGELWCVVRLPWFEAGARTPDGGGLPEHLLAVVDAAIGSN